ncbi:MAG: hypothetical protein V9E83_02135 [Baekduia sp.]
MATARHRLLLPALLMASWCAAGAAAANAATMLETSEQKIASAVRFEGVGCERPAEQIVVLPKQSKAITPESPLAGTKLYGAGTSEPIAIVKRVYYAPGIITWEVAGTGSSCVTPSTWQTGVVTLRATVTTVRRVLTRATVIARGDRICRAGFAKANPELKGIDSAPFAEQAERYRRMARELRAMNRRLGALQVPSERKTAFRSFRNRIDDLQLAIGEAASAASQRDRTGVSDARLRALTAVGDAVSAARRYGFRGACAA